MLVYQRVNQLPMAIFNSDLWHNPTGLPESAAANPREAPGNHEIMHHRDPHKSHWIGLRENLQETMVFTIKYRAFLQIFP